MEIRVGDGVEVVVGVGDGWRVRVGRPVVVGAVVVVGVGPNEIGSRVGHGDGVASEAGGASARWRTASGRRAAVGSGVRPLGRSRWSGDGVADGVDGSGGGVGDGSTAAGAGTSTTLVNVLTTVSPPGAGSGSDLHGDDWG
ncbi:hypothetical protein ACFXGA_27425 [Actinosynnema sp. NPDC059335]|uniref:hypothetical protein n=1 Tax=Actinosynnema sp. NPDC059335 TaxID=3346804 RepID=UPI00366D7B15